MIDRCKGGNIVNYNGQERRAGGDRRSLFDRREMLDFTRLGTDLEKRESIIDRRESGRRSSDRITLEELERLR